MDPKTLEAILRLPSPPSFGARIPRWRMAPPGAIVYGIAYEVQSPEEVDRLQAYETDNNGPRRYDQISGWEEGRRERLPVEC